MTIKINFKNSSFKKNISNIVLFVDDKFGTKSLKKHVTYSEYSLVNDLLKVQDLKKKIIAFDISSKKKNNLSFS